eukprot:scaffold131064_cov69-Phaeocystis_antarctica.AAC.1
MSRHARPLACAVCGRLQAPRAAGGTKSDRWCKARIQMAPRPARGSSGASSAYAWYSLRPSPCWLTQRYASSFRARGSACRSTASASAAPPDGVAAADLGAVELAASCTADTLASISTASSERIVDSLRASGSASAPLTV